MSRFVRPETATLTLANGDTLTVRKRLTAGEQRAAYSRMWIPDGNGGRVLNIEKTGEAMIEAYLLDWSFTDDEGQPVIIRPDKYRAPDLPMMRAALDQLDYGSWIEVKEAIEAHEAAMIAERLEQKKTIPNGEPGPSQTSESPEDVAGRSSTSESSILMTTP